MKKNLTEIIDLSRREGITLLGVGVMSREEIVSALELCKELRFPLMFIASRNQIEMSKCGSGYVSHWNASEFSKYVRDTAQKLGVADFVYLCRDHGGPWQRDNEMANKIGTEEAIKSCLESYYEDLDAGFNLLHIDTSKDCNYVGKTPLKIAVDRTINLVLKLEEYRNKRGLDPVVYEISLEETGKDNCVVEEFTEYVEMMLGEFQKRNVTMPKFIVGDTGTYVRMDQNIGEFDISNVKKLSEIAAKNNICLKEHNADYVDTDILNLHPKLDIAMANVAPEFGRAETLALLELDSMVKRKVANDNTSVKKKLDFNDVITKKVITSGKWRKWIVDGSNGEKAMQHPEFRDRAVQVCAHYFFADDDVMKARNTLYDNVKELKLCEEPEKYVRDAIKESIKRYVLAFKLKDFNLLLG